MEREKYIMRSFINCTLRIIRIAKKFLRRVEYVRGLEINNAAYKVLVGKPANIKWKMWT
jgi:hypothetical protein